MHLDEVFAEVSFVGLDTSPFIYFVEKNPRYLSVMREIFRRIIDRNFNACTSVITLTEVLTLPLRQSRPEIAEDYKNILFNSINFQILSVDFQIAETAAQLRADYNLRTPDALQIATAIENGCDAFLCNDQKLKRVTELQIILLDELEL